MKTRWWATVLVVSAALAWAASGDRLRRAQGPMDKAPATAADSQRAAAPVAPDSTPLAHAERSSGQRIGEDEIGEHVDGTPATVRDTTPARRLMSLRNSDARRALLREIASQGIPGVADTLTQWNTLLGPAPNPERGPILAGLSLCEWVRGNHLDAIARLRESVASLLEGLPNPTPNIHDLARGANAFPASDNERKHGAGGEGLAFSWRDRVRIVDVDGLWNYVDWLFRVSGDSTDPYTAIPASLWAHALWADPGNYAPRQLPHVAHRLLTDAGLVRIEDGTPPLVAETFLRELPRLVEMEVQPAIVWQRASTRVSESGELTANQLWVEWSLYTDVILRWRDSADPGVQSMCARVSRLLHPLWSQLDE